MRGGKFRLPPREDWVASLVVFVVAVPLSLGIALASGAPVQSGLIAAIVGGVLTGWLAGAPLVVSGPAAGLSALVFQLIQQHGWQALPVITVLAGLFQLGLGVLRAGGIFQKVPRAVLDGMLAAIGGIILLGQVHVLFGSKVPSSPVAALEGLFPLLGSGASWGAPVLWIGAFAIAAQLLWPKIAGRWSWIPGALPAVVLATLFSMAWEMPRVELTPLLDSVGQSLAGLPAAWSQLAGISVAGAALGLALVASAESLLTARAVDGLASQKGIKASLDLNRELLAQGAGNAVSGALGGLPITGVIVRSAANLNSGAKTRASAILHGLWIALFVLLLPFVLNQVPLSALASVLILTGVKLLNLGQLKKAFAEDAAQGTVWVATMIAIFTTDLLRGLIIALIFAAGLALVRRSMSSGAVRRAAQ